MPGLSPIRNDAHTEAQNLGTSGLPVNRQLCYMTNSTCIRIAVSIH